MENTANKTYNHKKIIVKISAGDFLTALLNFVMSNIQFMLYMNPFGMAFYSATFTPTGWYWSFFALVIGTVFSKGDFTSVRYILASGLATPVIAFSKSNKPVFRALVISVSYLLVSTALMFTGKFLKYDYIVVAFESFICFVFCCLLNGVSDVFMNYKQKDTFTQSESVSVTVTLLLLLSATSAISDLFGLRMCDLVAVFALMCLCINGSIGTVVTGGVLTGVAVCVAGGQSVAVVGAYAFCSIVSAFFKKYSRLGIFFGFTFANTIITAFFNREFYLLINPLEIFVSGIVFVALPPKTINMFNNFFDKLCQKEAYYQKKPQYNYDRIKDLSDSLSILSLMYSKDLRAKVLGRQYINNLFNMCVDRVCRGCGLKMSCWQNSTYRNYEYMSKMFEYAHKKGTLDISGLPEEFVKRCVKKEEFIRGFNFCYDIYKTDKIWLDKIFRIKSLMSDQLMAVSHSLNTCFEKQYQNRYNVTSHFVQQNKTGESVCGDCVCEVQLADGNIAAVLADGMGSGADANSYSNETAKMFAHLVNVGVDAVKAVELINLSMCIKSERECFSTMDILYLDMENNSMCIIKAGTAPTYMLIDDTVKKYECNTLPVGILKDIQIQKYTIGLTDNVLIVMISDGIANTLLQSENKQDWIEQLIEQNRLCTAEEISKLVLKEAIVQNNSVVSDDMTAYVLKIEK